MVIGGHFKLGTGPCESVMVPLAASIPLIVPLALAVGAALSGCSIGMGCSIGILSMGLSFMSAAVAVWMSVAVRMVARTCFMTGLLLWSWMVAQLMLWVDASGVSADRPPG
ncbi:hypothetical protein D3C81_1928820 [compost metagenome]